MPGGIILFAHFGPKNQARKVHKDIEPNQAFMYSFMCQTVLIFPIYIYIYILFTKRIDAFWSEDISIQGISTF